MTNKVTLYKIIRGIHLYSAMIIAVFLLMYLGTSFMMVYHNWFEVDRKVQIDTIAVTPNQVPQENWTQFLKKNKISGRFTRERTASDGTLLREYSRPGEHTSIHLNKVQGEMILTRTSLNLWGDMIGLHRLRGYQGSLKYVLYAIMVDLVGISLILFSVTGIFLWLKLLKNDKVAWVIFFSGMIYVAVVIFYLMSH